MADEADSAYDLNAEGTAKNPKAFQQALRDDPAKMEKIMEEPEVAQVVLGDDLHAFQELLKSVFEAEKKRQDLTRRSMAERTIDAQRVDAPIPRDTVQIYQQLYDSGLQYGPSFRLLRNVHTPEMSKVDKTAFGA